VTLSAQPAGFILAETFTTDCFECVFHK
jgi:hypothetical protein